VTVQRTQARAVAVVAAASVVAGLSSLAVGPALGRTPANADQAGPLVQKLATHLGDPFGLQWTGNKRFVVAENSAGRITEVAPRGHRHVLVRHVKGVAGVAASRDHLYGVLGGPDETGAAPPARFPATTVFKAGRDGRHPMRLANLEKYELAHNPDKQAQFDPKTHQPFDALSNPFSMNYSKYGLLVADGGANDVLRVNPRTGKVSTFFVPPTVKDVPACLAPGAQANPGTTGCDPVPTGIAVARGAVYVSTLGALVPGAGRVYKLNPHSGRVLHTWKGLTGPTGIAVSKKGTIFVSEVTFGAPEGPPPAGFDPSKIGRITRISCDGHVAHAAVTMPTGMTWHNDHLYSTAWSVAAQFGIAQPGQELGQVVWVKQRAFH
jgi:hypothetical protein